MGSTTKESIMKSSKKIIFGMFFIVSVAIMSSCSIVDEEKDSVSVSERIDKFEKDVNSGDDIEISENFHSEMESSLKTNWYSIFVNGPLDSTHTPVIFSEPTSITESTLTNEKTARGVMLDKDDHATNYTMIMKEEDEGDDIWMIKSLQIGVLDYLSVNKKE
jgi:hypothetical protein